MRRKSMKYIHKQIYSDLPAFIMRDDEVVDSFKRKSPWAFSLDDSPFTEYINTSLSEDVEQMETDPGSRSIGMRHFFWSFACKEEIERSYSLF